MEAALHGQPYTFIVAEPYRWTTWAAPKAANAQIDYHRALTGDDLREFVDQQLFPYCVASPSAQLVRTQSSTRLARSSVR